MVVDYRELHQVAVRKFFLIPNFDYVESTIAGDEFFSVGDLKEGFNQVDNEPDTKKKMADWQCFQPVAVGCLEA